MGDTIGKIGKESLRPLKQVTGVEASEKAAKKAAAAQQEAIAKQKQQETRLLAEEESEIARKKQLAKGGNAGRSLLIKTGETGTKSASLGGSQ